LNCTLDTFKHCCYGYRASCDTGLDPGPVVAALMDAGCDGRASHLSLNWVAAGLTVEMVTQNITLRNGCQMLLGAS